MPAQHRAAALVISVVAGTCVLLAGCGSSSSRPADSTGPKASAGPMIPVGSTPASGTSGTGTKLTGNFCTDFKNFGQDVKVPSDVTSSLAAMREHGARYLDQAEAYFKGLAAEAPPQVATELRVIASDYQAMAASISTGNAAALTKTEQKMASLTTKGPSATAFRKLVLDLISKCGGISA